MSHACRLLSVVLLLGACSLSSGEGVTHRFLACGNETYLMEADGQKSRTWPFATRDGYVLEDGTVLLTIRKSKTHPGGAVVEYAPDGEETLIWEGTQAEVNSAEPSPDGTLVLTESGPKPRLLEIDREGNVLVEFPLECQMKNFHKQTRMARKLADGTYLAPHLDDFAVVHYGADGEVLGKLDTGVPGDPERKIHSWPFTAIRHGDGHTLVSCTNGNRVVDYDANGEIAWQLTNEDLPGPWLQDPCGCQLLPNGNVVVTSYGGGRKNREAPKMFEVTPEKKVVWKHTNGAKFGIHHFHVITTNGEALGPALK